MAGVDKKQVDLNFKEAYRNYYTSIYRYCLAKLRDNHLCDDVVQETFIVLYKKLLSGEEIIAVRAFLYRTADNYIRKKYAEKQKSQSFVSIDEIINIPSQKSDVDERLTFEQYSRQISAALTEREGELFSMRYIEELPIEDIADRLGISVPAATTRLFRMRNKLREILKSIL